MAERDSSTPTMRKGFIDGILNHFTGADTTTLTFTPTVHLIGSAGLTLTPNSLLTDLQGVEAAYSGYGAVTPTLTAPVNLGSMVDGLIAPALFVGSSTTTFTPGTIYGYWLQNGSNWVEAELFPNGQTVGIGQNGDYLQMNVKVGFPLLPVLPPPT